MSAMKTNRLAGIVGCVLALGGGSAAAQSLRCNGEVVAVGDTRAAVLHKCGQPVLKDSFCRRPETPPDRPVAGPGRALPCEDVDEWTYNPGYGQFMTTVRILAGKVSAIVYGERVK
jgi:Protein of unknown function (DUF2845)